MQSVAELQDTLVNSLSTVCGGGGSSSGVQLEPSQCAANGTLPNSSSTAMPTATHASGAVHETPEKPPPIDPLGSGALSSDHELPCRRSTRGSDPPPARLYSPTATHDDG